MAESQPFFTSLHDMNAIIKNFETLRWKTKIVHIKVIICSQCKKTNLIFLFYIIRNAEPRKCRALLTHHWSYFFTVHRCTWKKVFFFFHCKVLLVYNSVSLLKLEGARQYLQKWFWLGGTRGSNLTDWETSVTILQLLRFIMYSSMVLKDL